MTEVNEQEVPQSPHLPVRFTLHDLGGDRVGVRGTDKYGNAGQTVLDGSRIAAIDDLFRRKEAEALVDGAAAALFGENGPFAEFLAISDQVNALLDTSKPVDPTSYIVVEHAVEGPTPKEEVRVDLSHDKDTWILHLISIGEHDRLTWWGNELEVERV